MLKSITLKNFRKHESLEVIFHPGMNIIRAHNEAGKSTLIEALGYNWFGSSALRNPIKETVTHGKKPGQLSTTVKFNISGQAYTSTRSNKGAELYKEGSDKPLVTGQKEVTSYIEELFGLPAGKATSLMIAEQGDIRGVLNKGAADTAKFIEMLANFSEIDSLVEKVGNTVTTGTTAPERERVDELEVSLAELVKVAEPDEGEYAAVCDALGENSLLLAAELSDVLAESASIKAVHKSNADLIKSQQDLQATIKAGRQGIIDLGKRPPSSVASVDHGELKELYKASSAVVAEVKLYKKFLALPTCADSWDEDLASFSLEFKSVRNEVNSLIAQRAELLTTISVKNAGIILDTVCPTCGQDVPDASKVLDRNTILQDTVTVLRGDLDSCERALKEQEDYSAILEEIQKVNNSVSAFADGNGAVSADWSVVPAVLTWTGATEIDESIKESIRSAEKKLKKFDEAQAKVAEYDAARGRLDASVQAAVSTLGSLPQLQPERSCVELTDKVIKLESSITANRDELTALQEAFAKDKLSYQSYTDRRSFLTDALLTANNVLKEKELSNILVKDIRAARVKVGNQIWSSVLTVVSNYFSKMRGEMSTVTRGEKEFLVNSRSIKGLSGSTLDILGLAFRMAQSELFLSGLPLLILDEATSGCDKDRTSMLIGLLKSASEKQTIMITHESISSDVADNLIEL